MHTMYNVIIDKPTAHAVGYAKCGLFAHYLLQTQKFLTASMHSTDTLINTLNRSVQVQGRAGLRALGRFRNLYLHTDFGCNNYAHLVSPTLECKKCLHFR